MIRSMIATAAVAAAVFGAAGPAAATATGPAGNARALPKTHLELSYEAVLGQIGYAAAASLTCKPAGGGHPEAAKACATLAKANGKPGKIKPKPVMCTTEYAPITAAAVGTWKGKTVKWKKTFPNHCDMVRRTGALFTF